MNAVLAALLWIPVAVAQPWTVERLPLPEAYWAQVHRGDPELPLPLDKVHPLHEVVKIDYFLPGCPPSADTIWTFLNELLAGEPVSLPYQQIHYD